MAGYRFIDLVTDIETISNITGQRAMVKRFVNNAVARIASAWNWPNLWAWTFFTTDDDVTAGDADVTNGSTSVTSNNGSTSWAASVVGRKFRIGSQQAYYTIATRVSSTSITLDQPYQGTTSTDNSYTIYQDEYYLRMDVDYYKLIRQIENGVPLLSRNVTDLDSAIPTPQTTGASTVETFLGRAMTTYTTGTVSASSGSRTLTGSGTAWTTARGVGKGTKIQIGSSVFTVNTVDSATAITLYEATTAAISSGTSYTMIISNPIVQIYPLPDTQSNYYYRFQRIPAILDADQDIPDLPLPLHPLIIEEAMVWMWEHKGFPDRMMLAKQRFDADLQQAILHYGHSNPDRTYPRQLAERGYYDRPPRPIIVNY